MFGVSKLVPASRAVSSKPKPPDGSPSVEPFQIEPFQKLMKPISKAKAGKAVSSATRWIEGNSEEN